jgi:hypothetical protein
VPYEEEFPEDASMKPPREFFVPLEALLFKGIYPDFFIQA